MSVLKRLPITKGFKWLFDYIRSGKKTLDIRLGYPQIAAICINDHLLVVWGNEQIEVRIIDKRWYGSFEATLDKEPIAKIAPGMSRQSILKGLHLIYPDETKVAHYKVVVLQLERI